MYFVNPDYISQVFLESQPRTPRKTRRAGKAKASTSTPSAPVRKASPSRLWAVARPHRVLG